MRYCGRCHIDYTGELDRCPLCGTQLTGEPTPSPFPVSTWYHLSRAMHRTLVIVGLLATACAIAAGFIFGIPALLVAAVLGVAIFIGVRLLLTQGPLGARLSKFFSLR